MKQNNQIQKQNELQ